MPRLGSRVRASFPAPGFRGGRSADFDFRFQYLRAPRKPVSSRRMASVAPLRPTPLLSGSAHGAGRAQAVTTPVAGWQSGHAAACKAVYAGSIPTPASKKSITYIETASLESRLTLNDDAFRRHRRPGWPGEARAEEQRIWNFDGRLHGPILPYLRVRSKASSLRRPRPMIS